MGLRKFRNKDREVLARLGVAAFGEGAANWRDYYTPGKNPRIDLEQVYVVEADGEARATAAVLPLEVFVDGAAAPMGGVAAVDTHPAYRRRGYAGELMRAVLRELRDRGVSLSMLSPFAHSFYRVYGWELATESVEYRLKPTELPTSPEQKRVRAYGEGDLPQLMALLDDEAARHPVCVRRDEGRWRQVLGRQGIEVAVYEGEAGIEGYLLYRQSEVVGREPPYDLCVLELIACTPEAGAALISFMAAYDPMVFEVRYATPRGEPLHPYLESSYVEAKISPDQMLRLVDVEGALKLLNRRPEAPLALEVADDVIPENNSAYTVGDGEVVRGVEAGERVALDVRRLAQLYAGYLPARQLVRRGLVRAGSEQALGLLEEFFPVGDPWVAPLDRF